MKFRVLLCFIIACILLSFTPLAAAIAPEEPAPHPTPAPEPTIALDAAVKRTIQTNPWVNIHWETVAQSAGELQQSSGAFDTVAIAQFSLERDRLPLDQASENAMRTAGIDPPEHLETETNTYTFGVTKLTRYGVSLTPSLSTSDIDEDSPGQHAHNYSSIDFSLNVPLLRNLGREATGAVELARGSALAAARFTARHNISQLINYTVASFWGCLANQVSFELTIDSQRRARKLLDLVASLVRAGSLEPAALNQARANLLSSQVDVRSRQERLYAIRQALAVSMGLGPEELPHAPRPVGAFPEVLATAQLEQVDIQAHIRAALQQRGDYLGAQTDIETAAILVRQAENLIKPRLDLESKVGYNGLSEEDDSSRYYKSLSSNLRGLNYLLTLNLELPIQNNSAKGDLAVRESQARVAKLTLKDLANQIASETLVAYEGLLAAAQEYELSEQAEAAYLKTVEFETRKYMVGNSTLTAVIDAEGRYLNARTAKIDVLRKYATALAYFRYVTGSLVDHQDVLDRFDPNRLLVFPVLAGNKS